jgi:protocatechuate 3,4-dioxygenase beta subunit
MDFILNKIKDPRIKESLLVPFTPVKGSKTGEVSAKFDIVLGITPQD